MIRSVLYFFKVWWCVSAFLLFCYFAGVVFNGFMDWVVTFTEEQILAGLMVFVATLTAAVMTWLRWLRII